MSHNATEVAIQLAKMREQNWDRHTEGVSETVEEYTRRIVEQGTFTPDGEITATLPLTTKERLTGTREQDMTAVFIVGAMIGAALERDVPEDSDVEDAWRNGDVELPEFTEYIGVDHD